mmetsp:Transcript_43531/g.100205  ORF Transcript_43531/g.100205 Transcript_43531/m.100205 type:complete len:459 (+) Transcript_43531:30-1406(+)
MERGAHPRRSQIALVDQGKTESAAEANGDQRKRVLSKAGLRTSVFVTVTASFGGLLTQNFLRATLILASVIIGATYSLLYRQLARDSRQFCRCLKDGPEQASSSSKAMSSLSRQLRRLNDWRIDNWRVMCYAAVTFISSVAGEMQLEAATQSFTNLDAQTTALVATCGEFAGCCFFAFLMGGRFRVAAEAEGLRQIASVPNDGFVRKIMTFIHGYVPFAATAFLVCLGTGLANMAVAYLQYPVKVIFKSSKLVPSMAVSVAFGNSQRFTLREYLAGLAFCLGTAAFTSSGAGRTDTSAGWVVVGIIMLVVAILCECLVSNVQEWMFRQQRVTPMTLTLRQNFLSLIVCSVFLLLQLCPAEDHLGFLLKLIKDPYALRLFLVTGTCTGISVCANMHLINEAGTVRKEELSLVRKVFTVMISYRVFPKIFSWRQGAGFTLISAGLWMHNATKRANSRRPN